MKLFSTFALLVAHSSAQDYNYDYESDLPSVTGRKPEEGSGAEPTTGEMSTTTTPTTIMADEPLYVDPESLIEEEEEVNSAQFQPRAMMHDVDRPFGREISEVQERFNYEDAEERGKKKKENQKYPNKKYPIVIPYEETGYDPKPGYNPNPGYDSNPGYAHDNSGYESNPGYGNQEHYGGKNPGYGKPGYSNENNYGHQYGNGPGYPKDPNNKDPYVTIEPYTTEYYKNDLKCFHCDAPSFLWCYQFGKVGTCGRGEVCMTEIRQRDGRVFGVCMGCKAKDACLHQKKNNFYKPPQCRPKAYYGESVCRQCCNTDYCTNNFNPKTREGWEQDLIYKNY